MKAFRNIFNLCAVLFLLTLSSCATLPERSLQEVSLAYSIYDETDLLRRYAPVFVCEEADKDYNRIGTPLAVIEDGVETISIHTDRPAVYTSVRRFTTAKDTYTNLIYRIHFSEVPFGIAPFYLGAGKNVGLLIVVTLDGKNEPVLYSLLHTCGCYLAFIPTSNLSEESWPPGWQKGRQDVYSENLPSYLSFTQKDDDDLFLVHIRKATHRVKNVWLANTIELKKFKVVHPELETFQDLENLPLGNGQTTSFYETSGPRRGYVKGSHKIWERLLISWWSFDWRVGEDKKLGQDKEDGIVFYTSLKPWAREASDLRDFPQFLRYWGWRL